MLKILNLFFSTSPGNVVSISLFRLGSSESPSFIFCMLHKERVSHYRNNAQRKIAPREGCRQSGARTLSIQLPGGTCPMWRCSPPLLALRLKLLFTDTWWSSRGGHNKYWLAVSRPVSNNHHGPGTLWRRDSLRQQLLQHFKPVTAQSLVSLFS